MVSPASSHPASPMSTSGRFHAPHLPPVVLATSEQTEQTETLAKARAFAEPLIASETLDTGENILAHADAVAAILADIGGSVAMQASCYLVYACPHLNKPEEVMAKAFGPQLAQLAMQTNQLVHVQRLSRAAESGTHGPDNTPLSPRIQTENVRKMLLAFSRDLRVVMLRLASRLQTLRHYAATKEPVPAALASESLQVFAPLANRLGIWQVKWEMEDLSFRFLEPETYKDIARLLDEKRTERERYMVALRERLQQALAAQGIVASVEGRPKHIYSIVRKMRGKSLPFERVFDIRALRV
ncbi:MAG: bifunctional (p)ppGpp synthetase/guanosine-3',5'-bis(diphosphate) 3'-pyrophosphohydrolase, partial [Betaproteobacteria bacterium]|nr:bifunctional (p)ppGpp synthetase/guanosine-3',5'-bis(diphosphate) 3'-pyrophosphohydrolase [Betaproteobacteria bacterium]